MFVRPDEEKIEAQAAVKLFLKLFPILAAHFQLRDGLDPSTILGLFQSAATSLAEDYQDDLANEIYTDEGYIDSLPSVLENYILKTQFKQ